MIQHVNRLEQFTPLIIAAFTPETPKTNGFVDYPFKRPLGNDGQQIVVLWTGYALYVNFTNGSGQFRTNGKQWAISPGQPSTKLNWG